MYKRGGVNFTLFRGFVAFSNVINYHKSPYVGQTVNYDIQYLPTPGINKKSHCYHFEAPVCCLCPHQSIQLGPAAQAVPWCTSQPNGARRQRIGLRAGSYSRLPCGPCVFMPGFSWDRVIRPTTRRLEGISGENRSATNFFLTLLNYFNRHQESTLCWKY